eukprot:Nk52_evm31s2273 gene=Nk52_evmTU31s2273
MFRKGLALGSVCISKPSTQKQLCTHLNRSRGFTSSTAAAAASAGAKGGANPKRNGDNNNGGESMKASSAQSTSPSSSSGQCRGKDYTYSCSSSMPVLKFVDDSGNLMYGMTLKRVGNAIVEESQKCVGELSSQGNYSRRDRLLMTMEYVSRVIRGPVIDTSLEDPHLMWSKEDLMRFYWSKYVDWERESSSEATAAAMLGGGTEGGVMAALPSSTQSLSANGAGAMLNGGNGRSGSIPIMRGADNSVEQILDGYIAKYRSRDYEINSCESSCQTALVDEDLSHAYDGQRDATKESEAAAQLESFAKGIEYIDEMASDQQQDEEYLSSSEGTASAAGDKGMVHEGDEKEAVGVNKEATSATYHQLDVVDMRSEHEATVSNDPLAALFTVDTLEDVSKSLAGELEKKLRVVNETDSKNSNTGISGKPVYFVDAQKKSQDSSFDVDAAIDRQLEMMNELPAADSLLSVVNVHSGAVFNGQEYVRYQDMVGDMEQRAVIGDVPVKGEAAIEEENVNGEGMQMSSVLKKRRLKMNKHKHKKRLKATRSLRKRLGKIK